MSVSSTKASVTHPQFHATVNPRREFRYRMHDVEIRDDFQWLEDASQPEVQEWTAQQHAATTNYLEQFQDQYRMLHAELTQLYDCDRDYEPYTRKGRVFFYRRMKGVAQRVLCTRIGAEDRVLFDPVQRCNDSSASIHSYHVNIDGEICAIGVQRKGAETLDVYFISSTTGEEQFERLESVRDFVWSRDSLSCFFKPVSKQSLSRQEAWTIHQHRFGTDRSADTIVHRSVDAQHYIGVVEYEHSDLRVYATYLQHGVELSLEGLVDDSKAINPSSILYSDADSFAMPIARKEWVYWFSMHDAPNGRILRSTKDQPHYADAEVLIEETQNSIMDLAISDDYIFISYRAAAQCFLNVYRSDGTFVMEAGLPEPSNISSILYSDHDNSLYVSASSYCTAPSLYKLHVDDWKWTRVWSDPTQQDLREWHTRYLHYASSDGTMVPLCVTCRRDISLDGTHPVLLNGYGGFGVGILPAYSPETVSFLQRGGIIAHAGIRGGDEYGEDWHRAAMREKKQNCFNDFIAAAEFLIREGYTSSKRLAIRGGSNGGLLVGAVACQRPELFAAVECSVPLLDMVRYVNFSIARFWIPEYGDPANYDDFHNLLAYSPYHQLREGLNLPSMLVCVAAHDSRTDPLHGKKFVAAAQSLTSQRNNIMLWVDYNAGHQGGTPTQSLIQESFVRWLYLMVQLRMSDQHRHS